jgi:hypothetical protein
MKLPAARLWQHAHRSLLERQPAGHTPVAMIGWTPFYSGRKSNSLTRSPDHGLRERAGTGFLGMTWQRIARATCTPRTTGASLSKGGARWPCPGKRHSLPCRPPHTPDNAMNRPNPIRQGLAAFRCPPVGQTATPVSRPMSPLATLVVNFTTLARGRRETAWQCPAPSGENECPTESLL